MEKTLNYLSSVLNNSTILVVLLVASIFITHTDDANAIEAKRLVKVKELKVAYYQTATHLSDSQLKEVLSMSGFKGQNLKKAWAIAKAESNGRPLAHSVSRKTGDNSYGIFQINMLGNLGEIRRDKYSIQNADLFNPLKNAEIAFKMTKGGTDWSSWSTYKSTRYTKFLQYYSTACFA